MGVRRNARQDLLFDRPFELHAFFRSIFISNILGGGGLCRLCWFPSEDKAPKQTNRVRTQCCTQDFKQLGVGDDVLEHFVNGHFMCGRQCFVQLNGFFGGFSFQWTHVGFVF